jgi:drug/metabolite transporter (DMT)-like permease
LKRQKAIALLLLAGALWSLGGLLIKSIPWHPLAISGMRGGIAALVIYIYSRNNKLIITKDKIIAACFYTLVVTFFVIANKLTTAGNAILLQYTAPVYVALFGYMVLGEKSKLLDWITIIIMLSGLALFFLDELSTEGFKGNILAILSGMCFAGLTLLLRKQKNDSPSDSILLGNILTLLIGLPVIVTDTKFNLVPLLLVFLLGVFQLGIPYILYTTAIKHVNALDAIIFPVIEPILNPILVFLILGETLGPWSFFGGALVLGSVVLRAILKK